MKKLLFILLLFLSWTAWLFSQDRGATYVDVTWNDSEINGGIPDFYIGKGYVIRGDTLFIAFTGSTSDNKRFGYVDLVNKPDSLFYTGAQSTGTITSNLSGIVEISNKLYLTTLDNDDTNVFEENGKSAPTHEIVSTNQFKGMLEAVSFHADTAIGGTATSNLYKYYDSGGTLTNTNVASATDLGLPNNTWHVHAITYDGTDTVYISYGDNINWNVFPDSSNSSFNYGIIAWYSISTDTGGMLDDTLATGGKLRWIKNVVKTQDGRMFVAAQGGYPSQGVYEYNFVDSNFVKMTTPNDSLSNILSIQAFENTVYITTGGTVSDSITNKIYSYNTDVDTWLEYPPLINSGATYSAAQEIMFDSTSRIAYIIDVSAEARLNIDGTSTVDDVQPFDPASLSHWYVSIDSLAPPQSITLTAPSDGTLFPSGDTISVSWTSTNIDTVRITLVNIDTLTTSSSINLIAPDTTGTFVLTVSNTDQSVSDAVNLIIKPDYFIEIDTVQAAQINLTLGQPQLVPITILSNAVDSVLLFWSTDSSTWSQVDTSFNVTDNQGVDTTSFTWNANDIYPTSILYIKIENYIDTSITTLNYPTAYSVQTGHTGIDKRICWYSTNNLSPYSVDWCLNICCGWCTTTWTTGTYRLNAGTVIGSLIGKSTTATSTQTNQATCAQLHPRSSSAFKYHYIDAVGDTINSGVDRLSALQSLGVFKYEPFTWNGYSWYTSGTSLYVNDIVNSIDSLLVYDFTTYTQQSTAFSFKHFTGSVSAVFFLFDEQRFGSQTNPNPFRTDGSLTTLSESELEAYQDTLSTNQSIETKMWVVLYGTGFPGDAVLIVDVDFVGDAFAKKASVSDTYTISGGVVVYRDYFRGVDGAITKRNRRD